ncbi:MAG: FHA domain-containing protein [Verrucomicrobiaceae bacterium]|nr:MAG: FHA domain-containing protein [Verrucomicrobiaceae bacterium]
MPTLRIKLPDNGETTHVLRGDRITVGRRPDNIVQILDRSVSGYHAELIWEGDHYRLHDLGSTNFSFVEGQQITDFNLRNSCKIGFGNIECFYDASTSEAVDKEPEETEPKLTAAQMEKDMAFLRAENQELINKIDALQRRIDILSSARLVTGKSDTGQIGTPDHIKRITTERDELRFQISGVKLELEKVREELITTQKERDATRREVELLRAEKSQLPRPAQGDEKASTQKIILPPQSTQPKAEVKPEGEPKSEAEQARETASATS